MADGPLFVIGLVIANLVLNALGLQAIALLVDLWAIGEVVHWYKKR